MLVQLARGHSLTGLFGRYSFVSDQDYPPGAVAKWFVYHIAELDLYTGVLPFAALILLVVLARRLPAAAQAFLAATVALGFWLLLEVAAVDQTTTSFVNRVEERNIFYLVPLLVVALLAVDRTRDAETAALGRRRGGGRGRVPDPPAAAVDAERQPRLGHARADPVVAAGSADRERRVDARDPRRLLPGRRASLPLLALPAPLRPPRLLLVYFLVVMAVAEREWHRASHATFDAIGSPQPDWIDRALPSGAKAAILYTNHVSPIVIWENEFFNRVGRVGLLPQRADPGRPARVAPSALGRRSRARTGPGQVRYALGDEIGDACRRGARERRRPRPAPRAG